MEQSNPPALVRLSEGLGVTPPPMPSPLGYARVFTPWMATRKVAHGFARTVAVFSQEQMAERDKQWLALLTAHADA